MGILAAIPWTRYTLAGFVYKQDFTVVVTDAETKKPVPSAKVSVDGHTGITNNEGRVTITQHVGPAHIEVRKAYYEAAHKEATVPIFDQKQPLTVNLKATGRQTSLTVINKISGKPIESVAVTADNGIESTTDSKGVAQLVIPADKKTVDVKLMASGYNTVSTTVTAGETLKANEYGMTPAGKFYFLSNKDGTIDVVKSNLDGTAREVMIQGTGKEDANGTALLASRDWKYLALFSKREDGSTEKIYLIETATGTMSVMDGGNATFTLTGWSGHNFVYVANRTNVKDWEPKRQAVKSFDATTRKLTILDETDGSGESLANYQQQQFSDAYIVNRAVVYTTRWYGTNQMGKQATVRSVAVANGQKKDLKSFDANTIAAFQVRAYEPDGLYLQVFPLDGKPPTYYEFDDTTIQQVQIPTDTFTKSYPTYLLAPSGDKTVWSETRDGKLVLLIGDKKGEGGTQVPGIVDYSAYGWFTDTYILATQKGSELYIMPAEGGKPLKVTDYYKPQLDFRGYGYGYGGL